MGMTRLLELSLILRMAKMLWTCGSVLEPYIQLRPGFSAPCVIAVVCVRLFHSWCRYFSTHMCYWYTGMLSESTILFQVHYPYPYCQTAVKSTILFKVNYPNPSSQAAVRCWENGQLSGNTPDSWLKGPGFDSWQERRDNFLLQGQLSVLLFRYPFYPQWMFGM